MQRKWVQQDTSVGDDVINPGPYTISNVTAYACVPSDPFSLQEDKHRHTINVMIIVRTVDDDYLMEVSDI